jgi:hypothetical protein
MRPAMFTLVALLAAAAIAASDAPDDRRPIRRATDTEPERLKQYVKAYRRLSPDAQNRLKQLDQDLHDEDAATRARLFGVMERYALWLSRLPEAERKRVQTAAPGPERLRVVRDVLERQWLDGLPPARKEQLATATELERARLIDAWHREDRQRNQERVIALRAAEVLGFPGQVERFQQELQKFVKTELEPKLNQREKNRLQAAGKQPFNRNYLHQVWELSRARGLTPPGPADFWNQFREPRKGGRPE